MRIDIFWDGWSSEKAHSFWHFQNFTRPVPFVYFFVFACFDNLLHCFEDFFLKTTGRNRVEVELKTLKTTIWSFVWYFIILSLSWSKKMANIQPLSFKRALCLYLNDFCDQKHWKTSQSFIWVHLHWDMIILRLPKSKTIVNLGFNLALLSPIVVCVQPQNNHKLIKIL